MGRESFVNFGCMIITSHFLLLCLHLFNQTASLDDETADMFKRELLSRIRMLEIIQLALLSIGVIIFILCLIIWCVLTRKDSISNQAKFA